MTMKSSLKFCLCASLGALIITSCGGSNDDGSSPPPPMTDTSAPVVSFDTSITTVESASSVTINVNATDNVEVTSGPTVTCDNGGDFSGSTFTAPSVTYDSSTTCTATASDAAGNSGSATITLDIKAPIEFNISKTRVFESELFSIEKTNPPGDMEITQLSGEEAIKVSTSNESTRFRAPALEFDGTEQLSFEIVITSPSGETASTIISSPEVIGRAGAGIPVAIYDPALSLQTGFGTRTLGLNREEGSNIVAIRQSAESFNSDKFEIAMLGGITNFTDRQDYEDESRFRVEGDFEDVSYTELNGLGTAFGLAVLSKDENKLRWFNYEPNSEGSPPNIYRESDSFSVEKPCFVRDIYGKNFIWVGQEDNGLSVIELNPVKTDGRTTSFNEILLQNVGGNRSLCYIFPTRLAYRYANTGTDGLITLDYKSNEIVLFKELDAGASYAEVDVIPLQTETTEALEIVDVYSIGLPSRVPRSMGVLLSDGKENGVHRLIHITQDLDNDEISQRTYSWTGGIPVSLVVGNFGGDDANLYFTEDIAVITNSNQSLFFESNAVEPDNWFERRNREYAEPIFFETFPGAGSAVTVNQRPNEFGDVDIEDVLVSYPDTGELRYYSPDSTLPKFGLPFE